MKTQEPLDQCGKPEVLRVVVDDAGGVTWEMCIGEICLRDRSRAELMRKWSVRRGRKGAGPDKLTIQETQ
jgi:hypothetical protein